MNTGLKHILGMTATLLFLLMLIAWVDSGIRTTVVEVCVVDRWVNFYNTGGTITTLAWAPHADAQPYNGRFVSRRYKRNLVGTPFPEDKRDLGFGVLHDSGRMPMGTENDYTLMSFPHVVFLALLLPPAWLYLRFLCRRRRYQPPPKGAAI